MRRLSGIAAWQLEIQHVAIHSVAIELTRLPWSSTATGADYVNENVVYCVQAYRFFPTSRCHTYVGGQ